MSTTKRGQRAMRVAVAKTTRRRFLRHAGAAAGSALAMPWIARGARAEAVSLNRDPKTLVVAVDAAIENLDPATNNSWAFGLAPLYDGLTKLKGTSTSETVPALAETFEAGDGFASWTCTLRRGVRFPDGSPCDAAAVKANIVRTATLPIGQGYVWNLTDPEKQITVVDESILRFDFGAEPRPYFNLECASQYGFWIANAAAAAAHSKGPDDGGSEWLQANPQGTGPYRLESLDPGHEAVFVKNPEYWGGWQGNQFERVIARTVPLAGTRRQLLEEGEVDLIWPGTPEDTVALAQDPRFVVTDAKTCTMEFISLGQYGPLADPRARQAMNYAFDNAGYIRDVTRSTQSPPRGVFPSLMATADPDVGSIPFDLGKAHELFEAAGVAKGTELTLAFFEGFGNEAAGLLQAWLAELGISLKLEEKTFSAFIQSYFSDAPGEERPNMHFFSWWPNWDHPYSFAWVLFHKDAWGATGGNAGLYDNAEANRLIEAMRDAPIDANLKAMSKRLQRILTVEDPAWIPVAEERTHLVHRTDLRGLEMNPLYVLTLDMYALSRAG